MKKGVVFTMDAVFALYLSLVLMSTMMVLLEANKNYSEDSLALARLARDVYEIKRYNPSITLPSFIKTGTSCDSSSSVGSARVLYYRDIQVSKDWIKSTYTGTTYEKVCVSG